MGKIPEQIVAKDWEKAIWELNRILAAHRKDIDAKAVGGGTTVVAGLSGGDVMREEDETLHWVL